MGQNTLNADAVYTPNEMAGLLRVSTATIVRALRSGQLQGFKVGRQWRIWGKEVMRFVEETSS